MSTDHEGALIKIQDARRALWSKHDVNWETGNCRRCKQSQESIEDCRITECEPPATATKNTSGITPLDVRVLVKPDPVSDRIGSIIKPDSVKEQDKYAQNKATLVAVGANAWCEAKAGSGFVPPVPGDRILIAKYGGILVQGDDGEDYRIMNDADVTGVLGG